MTDQATLQAINMSVDIKKAILSILDRSDNSFNRAMDPLNNYTYLEGLRTLDANNDSIRSILNAIS